MRTCHQVLAISKGACVIQDRLPRSYRDVDEIRDAIRILERIVDDLPQAYKSLAAAIDLQRRQNLLEPTQDVINAEQVFKSAQNALSVAATKAVEISAEHHVVLHDLALLDGPTRIHGAVGRSRA